MHGGSGISVKWSLNQFSLPDAGLKNRRQYLLSIHRRIQINLFIWDISVTTFLGTLFIVYCLPVVIRWSKPILSTTGDTYLQIDAGMQKYGGGETPESSASKEITLLVNTMCFLKKSTGSRLTISYPTEWNPLKPRLRSAYEGGKGNASQMGARRSRCYWSLENDEFMGLCRIWLKPIKDWESILNKIYYESETYTIAGILLPQRWG